jgi:hypothetical protein
LLCSASSIAGGEDAHHRGKLGKAALLALEASRPTSS